MDVELFLVTQYDPARDLSGIGEELVTQTELVRDGGFSGVCVGEHHVTDDVYLLNEAALAHVAEHVGEMWLGTGMCLLPYHNPVRIAEFGATMDVLTGGRFRLGVAQGYRAAEFDAFGIDRRDAVGRLVEGIEVTERLWTEESVTYEGEYFQLDDVSITPQPLQKPRPPIWVGASNQSSIRRAARIADGWVGAHVPLRVAAAQAEAFRAERATTERGDATVGLAREVFVADTTEEAEALVRDPLMGKYESYIEWGQDDAIADDDFDSPWDKLRHERFLVGSPEDVRADIERYRDVMDLNVLNVRTQFPGLSSEDVHRSLELLIDDVLPAVTA